MFRKAVEKRRAPLDRTLVDCRAFENQSKKGCVVSPLKEAHFSAVRFVRHHMARCIGCDSCRCEPRVKKLALELLLFVESMHA